MTEKEPQTNLQAVDFEQWLKIAQQDADTFESMRLAAIEEIIESAPEKNRERLRCLQWRIDQERRLSKSPMGACIRISHMMWETLVGEESLTSHLHSLAESCEPGEHTAKPHPHQAQVIPLRPDC